MAKRLTDKHPAMIAITEFFSKMDEAGIKISVSSYDTKITYKGETFYLRDNESETYPMENMPPEMEFKLIVIENDDE